MKTKHLLNALQHQEVHKAIQEAQERNSADIVVYISDLNLANPLSTGKKVFSKLKAGNKEGSKRLLIFIAPRKQKFAVLGGKALHEKVGQAWWDELAASLGSFFKKGHYTEGIVAAVQGAGEAFREHFPSESIDRTGQDDLIEE